MNRIKTIIIAFALLSFAQIVCAQDYNFYLQKARQRLEEGDCSRAEASYNTYKDMTHEADEEIEHLIEDCKSGGSNDSRKNLSGGSNNSHSTAFNEAKKIFDNVLEELNKAQTCDDVDMAAFGVLGLLGVDGFDKLDETENKEFEELGEKLSKAMEDKKAALDCKDDYSWFDDDDYVDLGLPSGTWWKKETEEEYMTFQEAVKKYGSRLPTKEQWLELINNCKWMWFDNSQYFVDEGGDLWAMNVDAGYRITGPNGNSIVIKAEGYVNRDPEDPDGGGVCVGYGGIGGVRGFYLSSTKKDNSIWYLEFDSEGVGCYEWVDYIKSVDLNLLFVCLTQTF